MTIEELIHDVKEIQMALEDDTSLEDNWILYKANAYRADLIAEQYGIEPVINPLWLQQTPKISMVKTDAADDPNIIYNSITLGRGSIPAVIALPENLGLYRVTGSGGIIGLEPTDIDTLIMRAVVKEEPAPNYGWYAQMGTFIYTWPYLMEIKVSVIAENPTDLQILDGSAYRAMVISDPYPVDIRTAQMIVLKILTVDLKLNTQAISDVVNDSQSQLKILKDAETVSGRA